MERSKFRGNAGSVLGMIGAAAAVVVACGSEPKKEPTAATATPPTSEAPTAPATAEAGASTAAPADATADAGGKSGKQAECDALVDDANSALDAKRIEVDKACKKDADCVPIKGRACGFACTTGAIPKGDEKSWNAAVEKVKSEQCKKWNDDECSKLKLKPAPTCQDRKVWCDKGHCALK